MQISHILSVLAVMVSVTVACDPSQDCCWSGRGGCRNQHKTRNGVCDEPAYQLDFCNNFGVECGADCCAISTGWGRGCP
ncbi:hypothetical protein J7T55_010856 [Diaporthe amygdali]|uniref:uncharacterized protein n=1 Tax=Phomopsis amygdali TaxID=1214568 RepID=UPI0022FEC588|nr:uncharacterized protein J7T55_010856 [Diaporthe amygdali]KAJ0114466.1 hypothetical protein J7T55_010856 [Diaporthe amygdali]